MIITSMDKLVSLTINSVILITAALILYVITIGEKIHQFLDLLKIKLFT